MLENFRKENLDVPVLILSARDGIEDKVKGLDLGANDYLTKPFHFAELEARVRSLLRRKTDIVNISWHIFLKDITIYAANSKVS